jgi:type IV pilus assembly protein PilX
MAKRRQRGIVLVVALIMLALVSMLVAVSLRNATSTESVSSAVRVTELATQAAEIALRHCEASLLAPTSLPAEIPSTAIRPAPRWHDVQAWDRASEGLVVLPLDAVNPSGAAPTFHRAPECMVEPLDIASAPTPSPTSIPTAIMPDPTPTTPRITAFVITARGFGPEVPADPHRGRPQGTEVWLQSHLELNADPATAPRVLWRAWRQLFMR